MYAYFGPYLSSVNEEYLFERVKTDQESIASINSLLNLVFPHASHFTEEVLTWQYSKNPDGQALGFNAISNESLAGHYVTIPLKAEIFGNEEKGLLSLNTATHPEHRGKGLFTQLAERTYEAASREGYSFVLGVANGQSTHGFIKKLGFQLVSPLKAMIGIGPLKVTHSGTELDLCPVWTSEKMAWRMAHPARAYERFGNGRFEQIMSDTVLKGFRFMLSTNKNLPASMAMEGEVPFKKAYIGIDPDMSWFMRPYINVPKRFRRAPLNLIFKDLSGKDRSIDPKRVRFQAIDFDTL